MKYEFALYKVNELPRGEKLDRKVQRIQKFLERFIEYEFNGGRDNYRFQNPIDKNKHTEEEIRDWYVEKKCSDLRRALVVDYIEEHKELPISSLVWECMLHDDDRE